MRTNPRDEIRKLIVVYYSTRVIRFILKSHIRNQYSYKIEYKHLIMNIEIWIMQLIIASREYF
jgi:hypothetical protein